MVKPKELLKVIDNEALIDAIARAEGKTSGEIRVFISPRSEPDPFAAAVIEFQRLGMEKTRERNAVLIFVAPHSKTLAVVGDQGVHEKCGTAFWEEIVAAMTEAFGKGEFTRGLVFGVEKSGEVLARHFPRQAGDVNELPDAPAE
jgi:uncharacterized membrane protein